MCLPTGYNNLYEKMHKTKKNDDNIFSPSVTNGVQNFAKYVSSNSDWFSSEWK